MNSSFAANLTEFIQRTNVKAGVVLRKLAFDAYRGVAMKTPVDTGRARANWRVGINVVDTTTRPEPERPGTLDTVQQDKINQAKWGDSIAITNNVPYIGKLEGGYSRQAPNGMLAVTFEELKANLARVVAAVKT
jgi:hypothetical protein